MFYVNVWQVYCRSLVMYFIELHLDFTEVYIFVNLPLWEFSDYMLLFLS